MTVTESKNKQLHHSDIHGRGNKKGREQRAEIRSMITSVLSKLLPTPFHPSSHQPSLWAGKNSPYISSHKKNVTLKSILPRALVMRFPPHIPIPFRSILSSSSSSPRSQAIYGMIYTSLPHLCTPQNKRKQFPSISNILLFKRSIDFFKVLGIPHHLLFICPHVHLFISLHYIRVEKLCP